MLLCFLSALTSPKIFSSPCYPKSLQDSPGSPWRQPPQRAQLFAPPTAAHAGRPHSCRSGRCSQPAVPAFCRASPGRRAPGPPPLGAATRPSGPPAPQRRHLPGLAGKGSAFLGQPGLVWFFVVVVEIWFPSLPSLLVPLLTNRPSAGPPGVVPRSWKQARPCSPARPDRPALPALPKPNSSSPTHTLYSANKLY